MYKSLKSFDFRDWVASFTAGRVLSRAKNAAARPLPWRDEPLAQADMRAALQRAGVGAPQFTAWVDLKTPYHCADFCGCTTHVPVHAPLSPRLG
jgi:hypothetical protein